MNTPLLSPYLTFAGNCKEAMEFYQSVLGGKLEMNTFGESPVDSDANWKEKIMHASLINDTLSFMASDSMPHGEVIFGNSVNLSLAGTDEKQLTAFFDGLSQGGKVDFPLKKQFWGDTFGMFTDKFGIHWMVNISSK